jgi:hypothetical protein
LEEFRIAFVFTARVPARLPYPWPSLFGALAASMRVVASHLPMRRVTIDTARDAVIEGLG